MATDCKPAPPVIHDVDGCCAIAHPSLDHERVILSIGDQHHEFTPAAATDLMIDLGHAIGECKWEESAGEPVDRPIAVDPKPPS